MYNVIEVTMNNLKTIWSDSPDTTAYPRPQMVRDSYQPLDGAWDYKIEKGDLSLVPSKDGIYDGKIVVPFSPESMLSGVNRTLAPDEVLTYRTFSRGSKTKRRCCISERWTMRAKCTSTALS